jgi:hypothetical protein
MATETKEVSVTHIEDQSSMSDTFPGLVRRKTEMSIYEDNEEDPDPNNLDPFLDFYCLDSESFDSYRDGRLLPVHLGDLYHQRYRVMIKIGYGRFSTV